MKIAFRSAVITINPLAVKAGVNDCCMPFEVRVIHELLHLHFEPIWPKCERDDLPWEMAEAAVDSISWGLYRAKYSDKIEDQFTGTAW